MNSAEFEARLAGLRPRLYRTALMYLGGEAQALDAVDEAVFRALRSLKKLRQEEFFETWLTRILINGCKSELRRMSRLAPLECAAEPCAEDFDRLPLREAIDRLPPELREIVILRFFADMTLRETAAALDIPPGTAATRQRRALSLLRLELGEEDER